MHHLLLRRMICEHVLSSSLQEVGEDGEPREVVRGARMKDMLTGEEWDVKAKVVVNATGE